MCMDTITSNEGDIMDTVEAIRIADLIAEYRAARAAHRAAWERADAAFTRYMNGEVHNSGGARRMCRIAENASGDLHYATTNLITAGIDPEAIDRHDDTNRSPHYDFAA